MTVKLKFLLPFVSLVLAGLLGGCSKLDAPTPGTYRAYVNLRGGEVPFELQVVERDGSTALAVVHAGDALPITGLVMQEGTLQAQLPDAAGTLHATISRSELKGEVRLVDPQGKPQTLPFAADLDKHYRFIEQASTDNADISGYWQLEAISPEHFAAPVTVQLEQHFDAVEGQLHLPNGKLIALLGQVHGDEVYLSALGQGRAVLLKGKVNKQGELQGELWTNLSNAKNWVARRMRDEHVAALEQHDEPVRKVALPWAIPAQQP